jgi:hypothetical protein
MNDLVDSCWKLIFFPLDFVIGATSAFCCNRKHKLFCPKLFMVVTIFLKFVIEQLFKLSLLRRKTYKCISLRN